MIIGSLFTGYGGLDLAVEAWAGPGSRTAWTADNDPGASKIIEARFPGAPNLGDVAGIDWQKLEPVDVMTGGFPCQDVSQAGQQLGMRPGTRSGLWAHMAYGISQLRPRYVIAENVRGLLYATAASNVEPCPWCVGAARRGKPDLRALGAVLGDLAELGYDARWLGLLAADVGAPHKRFRVFVVASDTDPARRDRRGGHVTPARGRDQSPNGGDAAPDADVEGQQRRPRRDETATAPGERQDSPRGRSRARGGADPTTADPDGVGRESLGRELDQRRHPDRRGRAHVVWGDYEPAISRWETILGREAPAPTELGPRGKHRLTARFVEWMMGLPAGWVTDVELTRPQQLRTLGNGVVPQQALEALRRIA